MKTEAAKWETKKTRPSGRWTHPPANGKKKGVQSVRQGETRPWEGRQTIQQRKASRGEMGRQGQDPRENGHTTERREARKHTTVNRRRRDTITLGKADTPSN